MKYNDNDYKFYVLLDNNKIESGWEYKEDAEDQIENLPPKLKGKVLTLTGIKNKSIDPDDDSNWHTNIKESKFQTLYENILNELKTVDNSHILKDLNKTLNAFEEIAKYLSAEDGKDYVKYFNDDLKHIDDLLEDYGKGGSSLTQNMKSAVKELETEIENIDEGDDINGTDILKTLKEEFKKLKKELSTTHAM